MQLELSVDITQSTQDERAHIMQQIADLFPVRSITPYMTVSVTNGVADLHSRYLRFRLDGSLELNEEQRRFLLGQYYHTLICL